MLLPVNMFPPTQVITAWSTVALGKKEINALVVTVNIALAAVALPEKLTCVPLLAVTVALAAVVSSEKSIEPW